VTRTRVCLVLLALAVSKWAACDSGVGSHVFSTAAGERASPVPSDVFFYGHVLYGGDDAFLVDGRWYRPAADGWRVFTQEPLELELLRTTLDAEVPHAPAP
jgi:hypothetical protein